MIKQQKKCVSGFMWKN